MSMQIPYTQTLFPSGKMVPRRIEVEGVDLIMAAKDLQQAKCQIKVIQVNYGEVNIIVTKDDNDLASTTVPNILATSALAKTITAARKAMK